MALYQRNSIFYSVWELQKRGGVECDNITLASSASQVIHWCALSGGFSHRWCHKCRGPVPSGYLKFSSSEEQLDISVLIHS